MRLDRRPQSYAEVYECFIDRSFVKTRRRRGLYNENKCYRVYIICLRVSVNDVSCGRRSHFFGMITYLYDMYAVAEGNSDYLVGRPFPATPTDLLNRRNDINTSFRFTCNCVCLLTQKRKHTILKCTGEPEQQQRTCPSDWL